MEHLLYNTFMVHLHFLVIAWKIALKTTWGWVKDNIICLFSKWTNTQMQINGWCKWQHALHTKELIIQNHVYFRLDEHFTTHANSHICWYLSPDWKQKQHPIYTKCGLHCDMRWHFLRIVHMRLYKLHLLYVNTSWKLEQNLNYIIFEDRDQLNI